MTEIAINGSPFGIGMHSRYFASCAVVAQVCLAVTASTQSLTVPSNPVTSSPTAGVAQDDTPGSYATPIKVDLRAPNILLILLDDVGFADPSTFGGAIETPNLDGLPARGVRYSNFNTAAMCSPTRAALLSGCNH